MNPFLNDPVATPLDLKHPAHWRTMPNAERTARIKKQARTIAIAAGIAAGVSVGLSAHALDVNLASVTELERLKGVGPRTAKMIVQERSRAGAYQSLEDLSDRVRGLGERRVRALQAAGLSVSASGAGLTPASAASHPDVVLSTSSATKPVRRTTPGSVAKPEIISPAPF